MSNYNKFHDNSFIHNESNFENISDRTEGLSGSNTELIKKMGTTELFDTLNDGSRSLVDKLKKLCSKMYDSINEAEMVWDDTVKRRFFDNYIDGFSDASGAGNFYQWGYVNAVDRLFNDLDSIDRDMKLYGL